MHMGKVEHDDLPTDADATVPTITYPRRRLRSVGAVLARLLVIIVFPIEAWIPCYAHSRSIRLRGNRCTTQT